MNSLAELIVILALVALGGFIAGWRGKDYSLRPKDFPGSNYTQPDDGIPPCACVHYDAETCAHIRDGVDRDDLNHHRRKCECECHTRDEEDRDEQWGQP